MIKKAVIAFILVIILGFIVYAQTNLAVVGDPVAGTYSPPGNPAVQCTGIIVFGSLTCITGGKTAAIVTSLVEIDCPGYPIIIGTVIQATSGKYDQDGKQIAITGDLVASNDGYFIGTIILATGSDVCEEGGGPDPYVPEFSTIGILLALLVITIGLGIYIYKKRN